MNKRKLIAWTKFLATKFAFFLTLTAFFLVFGPPYRIQLWLNQLLTTAPSPTSSASTTNPPQISFSIIIPYDGTTVCEHNCPCQDDGQPCFDTHQNQEYVCSHGLMVLKDEYPLLERRVYLNRCKPAGYPDLKPCRFGETCATQDIDEGEPCLTEYEELSVCRCGVVLNISTPRLRQAALKVSCIYDDACEETEPEVAAPIKL